MIAKYFLLFIIYSFIGWILEVIDTRLTKDTWVNRGFMMGPLCPIYGCGSIAIYLFLNKYYNDPLVLFCMAIIICSILEYFTSFIMEKVFKMRWWDYSKKKFNLNGRICLETMIPFGLLGILMIYIINPFFLNIINKIPNKIIIIITFILAVLYAFDWIISFNVIYNLKGITKNINKDSTEEIVKAVKKNVKINKSLYNRLIKAFPNMQKIIKKNKKIIEKQIKYQKEKIDKIESKIEKLKSKK